MLYCSTGAVVMSLVDLAPPFRAIADSTFARTLEMQQAPHPHPHPHSPQSG
jgi:hypothetical protein